MIDIDNVDDLIDELESAIRLFRKESVVRLTKICIEDLFARFDGMLRWIEYAAVNIKERDREIARLNMRIQNLLDRADDGDADEKNYD